MELGFERMTPERTRALFDELGVKPQQRAYDNHGQTACCIIGALAYKYTTRAFNLRTINAATGMPIWYLEALIDGWDGRSKSISARWQGPQTAEDRAIYRAGCDDGRAAWEAMQNPTS